MRPSLLRGFRICHVTDGRRGINQHRRQSASHVQPGAPKFGANPRKSRPERAAKIRTFPGVRPRPRGREAAAACRRTKNRKLCSLSLALAREWGTKSGKHTPSASSPWLPSLPRKTLLSKLKISEPWRHVFLHHPPLTHFPLQIQPASTASCSGAQASRPSPSPRQISSLLASTFHRQPTSVRISEAFIPIPRWPSSISAAVAATRRTRRRRPPCAASPSSARR